MIVDGYILTFTSKSIPIPRNKFIVKTCPLVEQYLAYLSIIKNRSENTILEYRTDLLMLFNYILVSRNIDIIDGDFAQVDLKLIKSIGLHEMYSFITYCQKTFHEIIV